MLARRVATQGEGRLVPAQSRIHCELPVCAVGLKTNAMKISDENLAEYRSFLNWRFNS